MVLLQFILDTMINFDSALTKLVNDLRKSSPNLDCSFNEIFPISFSVAVEGHKPIFIFLDHKNSKITFSEITECKFSIKGSLIDIFKTISTGKLQKNIISGDSEAAIVFFNIIVKSDIDLIYLIDKYFGNLPAVLSYAFIEKLFNTSEVYKDAEHRDLKKRVRDISIRIDRLEAYNIL